MEQYSREMLDSALLTFHAELGRYDWVPSTALAGGGDTDAEGRAVRSPPAVRRRQRGVGRLAAPAGAEGFGRYGSVCRMHSVQFKRPKTVAIMQSRAL